MSSCRIDIINSEYINQADVALFQHYEPDDISYGIVCGDEQVELHIRNLQKNKVTHHAEMIEDDNNDTFSEITTEDASKDEKHKELSLVEGLMVIFDVKDKSSFEHVDGIIKEYKDLTGSNSNGYGSTVEHMSATAGVVEEKAPEANPNLPSSPVCPLEVVIIAGNINEDEGNWEVSREDFMKLAHKHNIKEVYEVGADLRESIFEILAEFGTTVYNKNKAFKELTNPRSNDRESSSTWRRLGDNETISGWDMRRLLNAESGDYSSFTDLESQALLPRNGNNSNNNNSRRISSTGTRSVFAQCFGNGPFARLYPFLMIVFAALMSVAVYLDHGDQPTSHEIFRMKNQMKEFKWPFNDPQGNILPSSHASAHSSKPLFDVDANQSSAPAVPALTPQACIFTPPAGYGQAADGSCKIENVNAEVLAENGSWPSGFSWSLYRKNTDVNGTEIKELTFLVNRDSFQGADKAIVSCDRFITQMCLNGNYEAYAQSSAMPGPKPVELRLCDDGIPVGNALEFRVADGTKGCVEQGFLTSPATPPSENGAGKAEVVKLEFVSPVPAVSKNSLHFDYKNASKKLHRVACVGDSITTGYGSSNVNMSYPSRLGNELGSKYVVGNFGHNGAYANMHHQTNTALNEQDLAYIRQPEYEKALDFLPHMVIIMFGTNDSKQDVWDSESYKAGLETIVRRFKALESKPVVYLMIPPTIEDSYYSQLYQIQTETLKEEVPAIVTEVSREVDVHLIDLRELYDMSKGLVSRDRIHPSDEGYRVMTNYILNHLKKSKLY